MMAKLIKASFLKKFVYTDCFPPPPTGGVYEVSIRWEEDRQVLYRAQGEKVPKWKKRGSVMGPE